MKAYPEYKDSGVEWLGKVPAGWRIAPTWSLFKRVKRTDNEGEELLSVYRDFGVVPKASRDDNFNKPSEDLSAYQLVEAGDLAINKMKAWQGSVAISEYRGIVSPAYFIFTPTHGEHPKYLHYLLRSAEYTSAYRALSKGIRPNQWDLEPQEHGKMGVLLPPLTEQRKIAAFLDLEVAKIDDLIEEQRRLIALLAEKRQATISHAVTKGLNPNAKLKPSGIDWLGDVPEGWDVTKAGRHLSILSGYAFPSDGFSQDDTQIKLLRGVNIGVGYLRWEDNVYWEREENDGLNAFEVRLNDIVMGMDRPWISGGLRIAQVSEDDLPCLLLQRVALMRGDERLDNSFLLYLYSLDYFMHYLAPEMTGVSVPHISPTQISSYPIVVPPLHEQQEIVAYLKMAISHFDELSDTATSTITLLQERRSALISAAVTGKIDLRDFDDSILE